MRSPIITPFEKMANFFSCVAFDGIFSVFTHHYACCPSPSPRLPVWHAMFCVVYYTRWCWCRLFVFFLSSLFYSILLFFFGGWCAITVHTEMEQGNVDASSLFLTFTFLPGYHTMYYALLFYGVGIYRPGVGGCALHLSRTKSCTSCYHCQARQSTYVCVCVFIVRNRESGWIKKKKVGSFLKEREWE